VIAWFTFNYEIERYRRIDVYVAKALVVVVFFLHLLLLSAGTSKSFLCNKFPSINELNNGLIITTFAT
jgi:hypothetical protein